MRDGCGFAVVVGASGGIGGALVHALQAGGHFAAVLALSRGGIQPIGSQTDAAVPLRHGVIDLFDEASIEAAVAGPIARLQHETGAPPRLILVATGGLQGDGIAPPERSFRALDANALLNSYRLNTVGPALVAKHMLPLLPRSGRSVFAALSARVGSIGDNRLGGWHAYRASKAALNMILRNLAIEFARSHPEGVCIGLHPGTVDTGLSRPFQSNVAKGKLFTPAYSASCLVAVIEAATSAQTGQVLDWDGEIVPP